MYCPLNASIRGGVRREVNVAILPRCARQRDSTTRSHDLPPNVAVDHRQSFLDLRKIEILQILNFIRK